MDRSHNGPVLVGSPKGGMDIEKVAEESPQDIFAQPIDIMKGITDADAISMAKKIGFEGKHIEQAAANMKGLYNLFITTDSTQVEINPMAIATDGNVYCVDAKLNFDDNAAFRQKDIFGMRDISMEDPRDVKAESVGLNYIALEGNIGCLVNGAGLAMATMDIIQLYGGKPANFLDVGGGATKQQVAEAFKILVSDPSVKAILVNIFGGIMKCDIIASGIIAAYNEVGLNIPVVVRLAGTNVDLGKELLKSSGLPIVTAGDLDDVSSPILLLIKLIHLIYYIIYYRLLRRQLPRYANRY
jgi:succinyl-CoA synthetase beta subunit